MNTETEIKGPKCLLCNDTLFVDDTSDGPYVGSTQFPQKPCPACKHVKAESEPCEKCGGSKKIICNTCDRLPFGAGRKAGWKAGEPIWTGYCDDCNGRGYLPCPVCQTPETQINDNTVFCDGPDNCADPVLLLRQKIELLPIISGSDDMGFEIESKNGRFLDRDDVLSAIREIEQIQQPTKNFIGKPK